jgi:hypothetical protein
MRLSTTIWLIAAACGLACSSSDFGGVNGKSDKKKSDETKPATTDDEPDDGTDTDAGIDPEDGSRVQVDCSALNATQCKEKVEGILGEDDQAQVEVLGCEDDEATTCKQVDDLGDEGDQVVLGDGGGVADEGAIDEDGELNVKDLAIGVGGPEKPAYFFRNTKAERQAALDCAHKTQEPSSFNPSASACKTSVRIGRVKFEGSAAEAEERAEATLPEQCVCRDGSSSPIPGIVWDKSQGEPVRPGQFTP